MPRREHQQTKRLIQQRQEQQRARPSSTRETSSGGVGGQQRQGVTVQFQPDSSDRHDRFASVMHLHDTPEQAFAAYDAAHSLPEVRARLDAQLVSLPKDGEALSPAQEAALDLTTDLARDLAIHAHHSHLDELIRRIPELGAACGRAVANALREAQ